MKVGLLYLKTFKFRRQTRRRDKQTNKKTHSQLTGNPNIVRLLVVVYREQIHEEPKLVKEGRGGPDARLQGRWRLDGVLVLGF